MSRRWMVGTFAGLLVAAGVLGLAGPADAQVAPQGKRYTIDFFGMHINAPFNLIFIGTDCVYFSPNGVACFPATVGDCGPYTITMVDGSKAWFEVDLTFKIGDFIKGPVKVAGVVDRAGPGSAMSLSGSGRMRSPDLGIANSRTNFSGHGLEGCFARPEAGKPEDNWAREDR